ncbi:MAG: hypothetical protein CMJ57_02975, partial [Planctomycetaceae bacterium]|nr:hypothetical protein [Planctomycetaceae bacterium]
MEPSGVSVEVTESCTNKDHCQSVAAEKAASEQILSSLEKKIEELALLASAARNLKPEALVDIYGEDEELLADDASAGSRRSTGARDARRRSIFSGVNSATQTRDFSEQFLQTQISMPAGAAAGSQFEKLSARISKLSPVTMSITGGETGGEIPLVGLTPTARSTMEDKISKALKGKVNSKADFQNLGGLPHMIELIRVAFR